MNTACTRCNGADHQRDDCAILRDLAATKRDPIGYVLLGGMRFTDRHQWAMLAGAAVCVGVALWSVAP